MKKGIDHVSSRDSDDARAGIDASSIDSDDDRAGKPRVLFADKFRSNSADQFMKRAKKVWAVSTSAEEEEDESQKRIPESKPESEEEKVGDIVRFGNDSYFVIDIFEKEIMELGDKVDLNYKRFNKFEAVCLCRRSTRPSLLQLPLLLLLLLLRLLERYSGA